MFTFTKHFVLLNKSCLSLYFILSFWGNERRQKLNIPHPRESLESQIGRQQSEAKQSLMSDKREGAFKDQVIYSAFI